MPKGPLACTGLLGVLALSAQAQERHALQTHMSAPASAAMTGRLPGAQRLSIAMTLSLRNETELDSLLQRLYDPLDVQGAATGNGTLVIASACHNGSNQIWAIN